MGDAVQLQLLVGPVVPLPPPRDVLDAVRSVKVESGSGDAQSGFELTFALTNRSPLHALFLLSGGASIPILRVVVAVPERLPAARLYAEEADSRLFGPEVFVCEARLLDVAVTEARRRVLDVIEVLQRVTRGHRVLPFGFPDQAGLSTRGNSRRERMSSLR